jgi:transaldolase
MKIFIDTANLSDIEAGLQRGFARGVTTNPSLLAKEPKSSFEGHVGKIIDLVNKYQPGIHLSVEVFADKPEEILRQAEEIVQKFNYSQISIKIPVGWNELGVIKELSQRGISVNCTACMTPLQAIMAAQAGAKYVSLFWGRIRDGGVDPFFDVLRQDLLQKKVLDTNDFDPALVVKSTRQLLDAGRLDAEIIVGSIRSITDIRDAALAGAHIITIPPKFFPDMSSHFKTTQVIDQFLSDFKQWLD